MNRQQLQDDLVGELAGILRLDIGVDDDLLFEGGLDSFGIMQMVAYLEETFQFRVPDEQLVTTNFSSARTIADWVLPLVG